MILALDFFDVVVKWGSREVMPHWAKYANVSEDEFRERSAYDLAAAESGQITMEKLWANLGRKFNVEPKKLESILEECFTAKAKLDDAVVDIIRMERQNGAQVVLLSNQLPWHAHYARDKGWFDYFDRVFLSFELGYRKPLPEAYQKMLDVLRVKAGDVRFFDDKEENVAGARALGIQAKKYESSEQLREELKVYKSGKDGGKYEVA